CLPPSLRRPDRANLSTYCLPKGLGRHRAGLVIREGKLGARHRQSPRSEIIGSTDAARRAGMNDATRATLTMSTAAAVSDKGSVGETLSSIERMSRATAIAPTSPAAA